MEGSPPEGVKFSWDVGDARHKRPYFEGEKKQATPAWKRRALERMHQLGITMAELARRIGADKSGLKRFLETKQVSSKYVDAICEVLGIDLPLIDNIPDDDLNEFVDELRDPAERRKALEILRLVLTR